MTILVNWGDAAAVAAGLAVLLGLTWLLRGDRAVARMCGAVGIAVLLAGLATGKIIAITAGVVILGTVCWCLRSLRGSGRRRTGGRA